MMELSIKSKASLGHTNGLPVGTLDMVGVRVKEASKDPLSLPRQCTVLYDILFPIPRSSTVSFERNAWALTHTHVETSSEPPFLFLIFVIFSESPSLSFPPPSSHLSLTIHFNHTCDPILLSASFLWTSPIFPFSELLTQTSQIVDLILNTLTSV